MIIGLRSFLMAETHLELKLMNLNKSWILWGSKFTGYKFLRTCFMNDFVTESWRQVRTKSK